MRKQKAFTLIELLVVIAIIALLLAILMPSLKMAKEHAKRLLCGKDLSSIGVGLALYAGQEDDYLPRRGGGPSNPVHAYYAGTYQHWSNTGIVATLNAGPAGKRLDNLMDGSPPGVDPGWGASNIAKLMAADLIDPSFPELLYCTSSKSATFSYEVYGGDEKWPLCAGGIAATSGDDTARIRTSYSYQPQHRYKKTALSTTKKFPAVARKYSEMDPARSVVMDLLNSLENMSHRSGGYVGVNILYGDGSVIFKRDEDNAIKDGVDDISTSIAGKIKFRELIKALE